MKFHAKTQRGKDAKQTGCCFNTKDMEKKRKNTKINKSKSMRTKMERGTRGISGNSRKKTGCCLTQRRKEAKTRFNYEF